MFGRYARSRIPVLAAVVAFVLGHRCATEQPASQDVHSVATFIGRVLREPSDPQAALVVDPASIQWEATPGPIVGALVGRRAFVLASVGVDGARDVYRVRARVSPEGHVLAVNQWRNLTRTPLSDEGPFAMTETVAAFPSQANDKLQGVTVLELDRPLDVRQAGGSQERNLALTWLNRGLAAVSAYRETGDWRGLGRVHLELSYSRPVELRLTEDTISIREQEGGTAQVRLSEAKVEQSEELVRRVFRQGYGAGQWRPWREMTRRLTGSNGRTSAVQLQLSGAPPAAAPGSVWPPQAVAALVEPTQAGEGQWRPTRVDDAPGQAAESSFTDTPFAYTSIRTDAVDPSARLHLVALDMRRLSLGVEAGYSSPTPSLGPPSSGTLPADPDLRSRVAAVFNGAIDANSNGGMMSNGRLLVPPVGGAATVAIRGDGWVGLGTWPTSTSQEMWAGSELPPDIVGFHQHDVPLFAAREEREGASIPPMDDEPCERSALCRTSSGHLYYAWGPSLSLATLARGLRQAGCSYAVHLGRHPGQGGLAYTRFANSEGESHRVRLADPAMGLRASDALTGSSHSFFFVTHADPQQTLSQPAQRLEWVASVGAQPAPSEWTALWESSTSIGTLPVRLLRVEPHRLKFALTASTLEPLLEGRPTPRRRLPEALRKDPLLAISLGHTTPRLRYGMAFGRRVTLPLNKAYGTLAIADDGAIEVWPSGRDLAAHDERVLVQLPELVSENMVTRYATQRGRHSMRGGICVEYDRVWVAVGQHDSSDAIAAILRDLGCATVLELDRGSRHPVEVRREQLSELAAAQSESSWIWGVASAMPMRSFEF